MDDTVTNARAMFSSLNNVEDACWINIDSPTSKKRVIFDYDDSQNCETLFWTNPEKSDSGNILCLHDSVDLCADYPSEEDSTTGQIV